MLRYIAFVFALVICSVLGDVKSVAPVDDTTRGGGGGGGGGGPQSQQYHYSSYGGGGGGHDVHGGGTYAGLSFDLSTGLFLALGAIIVLLALAAVVYPLLSKHGSGGGGGGGGWEASGWRSLDKSYNFAETTDKVLSAVEKMYDTYRKSN